METNGLEAGNLRRIKFYVCPVCGNVISNTGNADISCCGRRLTALNARQADEAHGCVCVEKGKLLDIFTPMREDFLT